MDRKSLFKRYILFIVGLFFAGVGVAFTKHGELGVSPISSVANVLSCKFAMLSMGEWLIVWNCILIVAQVVILKRDFKLVQLLQIPLSFLFGWFTDLGMWAVAPIPTTTYAMKLLMLFVGIVVLAFGITLSVIANVILNSGEAVVKAISDKTQKPFGNVKVVFDVGCVLSAVVLSLIFFDGKIVGAREGTILSAIFTGFVVKAFSKMLKDRIEKLL